MTSRRSASASPSMLRVTSVSMRSLGHELSTGQQLSHTTLVAVGCCPPTQDSRQLLTLDIGWGFRAELTIWSMRLRGKSGFGSLQIEDAEATLCEHLGDAVLRSRHLGHAEGVLLLNQRSLCRPLGDLGLCGCANQAGKGPYCPSSPHSPPDLDAKECPACLIRLASPGSSGMLGALRRADATRLCGKSPEAGSATGFVASPRCLCFVQSLRGADRLASQGSGHRRGYRHRNPKEALPPDTLPDFRRGLATLLQLQTR